MMKRPDVLIGIAMGRHELLSDGRRPPFVVSLSSEKAASLNAELVELGSAFGIPFEGNVPAARGDGRWTYCGTVLNDVHVYGRVP